MHEQSRVYRPKPAATYLGMGVTSLWAAVKAGDLPPPIKITGTAKGWPVEELDALIDRRKAERDAELAGEVTHA